MTTQFIKDGKINWVDSNNVMLGYDNESCCCENFGWYYANIITPEDPYINEPDLSNYFFDPTFCQSLEEEGKDYDEGGCVVFRLVAHEKPDIYLHIYNHHNGYYSHGFEFFNDKTEISIGQI